MDDFYRGMSMFRVFLDGDVLLTKKISGSSAVPGDVIVFDGAAGSRVVHRVIARRGNMLATMGDNNPGPDREMVDASGSLKLVTGFVRRGREYRIGRGRRGMFVFRCNRFRRFFRSAAGAPVMRLMRVLPQIPLERCRMRRFNTAEHFYFCGIVVARRFADGRVVFSGWFWRLIFR